MPADGAVKPRQGQVHGGNTGGEVHVRPPAVLFSTGSALYGDPNRNGVCDAKDFGGFAGCDGRNAGWRAGAGRLGPVPPFKGNDTGGIIAYELATQADARQLAVDHCAGYGKVVKFLAVQPYDGRLYLVRLPLGALWRRRSAAAHALLSRIVDLAEKQPGARLMKRQLVSFGSALPARVARGERRRRRRPAGPESGPVGNEDRAHRARPMPEMTMQHCTDETTDKEMSAAASPMGKEICSRQDIQKTATGYVSDSVCGIAGVTVTSHAEITGDFNSAYTVKSTSHSERGAGRRAARHHIDDRGEVAGSLQGGPEARRHHDARRHEDEHQGHGKAEGHDPQAAAEVVRCKS